MSWREPEPPSWRTALKWAPTLLYLIELTKSARSGAESGTTLAGTFVSGSTPTRFAASRRSHRFSTSVPRTAVPLLTSSRGCAKISARSTLPTPRLGPGSSCKDNSSSVAPNRL
jgi:hypothetical protein